MSLDDIVAGGSIRRMCVFRQQDRSIVAMDSVSAITAEDEGQIVVTGSHGGTSAAEYALRGRVALMVCSDAGFGRNDAGVAGLLILDDADVPGIAVDIVSARIGDGFDIWDNGTVSFLNGAALRAGFEVGQPLRPQLERFIAVESGFGE